MYFGDYSFVMVRQKSSILKLWSFQTLPTLTPEVIKIITRRAEQDDTAICCCGCVSWKPWRYPELIDSSVPCIWLKGSGIFDRKAKRSAFLDLNWFAFWSNKRLIKWFDWCDGFCYQGCRNGEHEVKDRKEGWPHLTHLTKLPPVPCAFGLLGHPPQCVVVFAKSQTKRWR